MFRADPPAVHGVKVKNLLVGLPPTDDEVERFQARARICVSGSFAREMSNVTSTVGVGSASGAGPMRTA